MSRSTIIVTARALPTDSSGPKGAHPVAHDPHGLLSLLPLSPRPEGVVLLGDHWLAWRDLALLARRLQRWLAGAPLSLVTSGRPYRRWDAVARARALGAGRATVELAAPWFRPGGEPERLRESLEGAARLSEAGLLVRVAVSVDRFSRGYLDELALEAARAGAVAFEPVCRAPRDDFQRLERSARARFARLRADAWPAGQDLRLSFVRPLPDLDLTHCPWRRDGWPGPEVPSRAAILCSPDAPPTLHAAAPEDRVDPWNLALRKHALGQIYSLSADGETLRALAPHPACVGCLQRLRCPTAFDHLDHKPPRGDDREGPAHEGPAQHPPLPPGRRLDVSSGPEAIRNALANLLPDEPLLVTGRSGRVLLVEGRHPGVPPAPASVSLAEGPLDLHEADPRIVDPQWVADLARVWEARVSRYDLPARLEHDTWWLELRREPVPPPLGPRSNQALLMVCNVCVTHCLMCGLPHLFDNAFLPTAHALRWLTELRLLGTLRVDLFGGEVTLRPDLLDLASFARHRGLRTSFITTGYQLGGAFLEALSRSDVDQVEVALDHDVAARHNHIKGGLQAFDDAVALVETLSRDAGRVVDVNTVILRENLGHLHRVVDLAASLGVDEHRLFSCVRFPLAQGLQEPLDLQDAARIWEHDVPEARRHAAGHGVPLEVCGAVDPDDPDLAAAYAAFAAGEPNPLPRQGRRCTAPQNELSLLIDGTVLPCQNPSFYVDLLGRPGNALSTWLWEVMTSSEFAALAAEAGRLPSCARCIAYRSDEAPSPTARRPVPGRGDAPR